MKWHKPLKILVLESPAPGCPRGNVAGCVGGRWVPQHSSVCALPFRGALLPMARRKTRWKKPPSCRQKQFRNQREIFGVATRVG